MQTNVIITKEYKYPRVSGKNLCKDIKDFVCPFAGYQESSKLRKRIIALQKMKSSVAGQQFAFPIE
jgi:hypothetical protein